MDFFLGRGVSINGVQRVLQRRFFTDKKTQMASHTIYLNCWKEYEIAVTSLISNGVSPIKDSQVWRFRTLGGIINGDFKTII